MAFVGTNSIAGPRVRSSHPDFFARSSNPAPGSCRAGARSIACGQGRNSRYLAERGFAVVAIDISSVALQAGRHRAAAMQLKIDWRQLDLEGIQLDDAAYDVVINFNYLQRSLLRQIKRTLKIGGSVIYETYLIDQKEIGHPKNPDYLLGHNELLEAFREFRVHCYREGKFTDGADAAYRAGIFAQKIG
ncbi:MAG TPA: class I SAM-dependent methyltransferase [Candidatus Binatus sp.]|nr:class I SAM-dependent methyltransferase [Candidatus Binatus sp.]